MDEIEELKNKIKALEEENEKLKQNASCEDKEKMKGISDNELQEEEREEIGQETEKEKKEQAVSKIVMNAIASERKRISDIHSVALKAHANDSDVRNAIDSGLTPETFAFNLVMNTNYENTPNTVNYKNEQKAYTSYPKIDPNESYHSSVEFTDSTFLKEYGNVDYNKIAEFILKRGEI